MDPPQQALVGMMSMGHAISIAGMPGVLQPHDEGYPGPLSEAFFLALGATMDGRACGDQRHPDLRQRGHALAHAHGEGDVQDGGPLHSLEAWADRADRHSAIWGWRRLRAGPAGHH